MGRFAVGVDGGGTGTRVVLADEHGVVLARSSGGPSALGLGIERAWDAIGSAIQAAFRSAEVAFDWHACTLCCGLSGVNNAAWRQAFEAATPAGATLTLVSDAYTTLWGAHEGGPGVIVALGTGSIAAALVHPDVAHVSGSTAARKTSGQLALSGQHPAQQQVSPRVGDGIDGGIDARALEERIAGGYGFPSGDEASGAWLGLRAVVYLQQVMDGRQTPDAFADALRAQTGVTTRDELVGWCCDANQTAYATLAPIVIAFGVRDGGHAFARALLMRAGDEIAKMIDALDPEGVLPVALCGGLAAPLGPFVPTRFAPRLREPATDAVGGALALAMEREGSSRQA